MSEPTTASEPTYSFYGLKTFVILKSLQCRRDIDEATVLDYAEYLKDDTAVDLPAIQAVKLPDGRVVIIDGVHRHKAYTICERKEIPALVTNGTMQDALWMAAAANKGHGRPRTMADKRRAVVVALRHDKYASGSVSMRDIAKWVGVSHTMVQDAAKKLDLKKKTGEEEPPVDPSQPREFSPEVQAAIEKIGLVNPAAADALLTGTILKPGDEIVRFSDYADAYQLALAPLFFGRRLSLMASIEIVEKKPTENSTLRDAINYARMQGEDIQLAFDSNTALITVSVMPAAAKAGAVPVGEPAFIDL
jgi:hypothetical protein